MEDSVSSETKREGQRRQMRPVEELVVEREFQNVTELTALKDFPPMENIQPPSSTRPGGGTEKGAFRNRTHPGCFSPPQDRIPRCVS